MIQIFRMLRTGVQFSSIWMKINQRNFEDAPHGSAIFEDLNMIKNAKSGIVSRGSAIFELAKNGILRMSRTGVQFS